MLADALAKRGHEVHWFAPAGSTPIGVFHPTVLSFGTYFEYDVVENIVLDRFKVEDCLQFDFIIDMSASARTPEELYWYYQYKNFCCYRNGYTSFHNPRLKPEERHLVVPSKQNQDIFKENGCPSRIARYGIPDFYCPGHDDRYWKSNWQLTDKSYWLFPHRPTPDKGIEILMQIVIKFPQEIFVIAGTAPITEHQAYLNELKRVTAEKGLKNLKFISLPMNPKHHYYKRELMRRAKGVISPLGKRYFEGFGLTNAEAVACGTPVILSESPSARELWHDEVDGLIVEGVTGFAMAIQHFNSYHFKPENHLKVEDYAKRYEQIAGEIMLGG